MKEVPGSQRQGAPAERATRPAGALEPLLVAHLPHQEGPLTLQRWQLRQVARGEVGREDLVAWLVLQAGARDGKGLERAAVERAAGIPAGDGWLERLEASGWVRVVDGVGLELASALPLSPRTPLSPTRLLGTKSSDCTGTKSSDCTDHSDIHVNRDSARTSSRGSTYHAPGDCPPDPRRRQVAHAGVQYQQASSQGPPPPSLFKKHGNEEGEHVRTHAAPQADLFREEQAPAEEPAPDYLRDLADLLLREYPHGTTDRGRWRKPARSEVLKRLRAAFLGLGPERRRLLVRQIEDACKAEARVAPRPDSKERQFVRGLEVWVRARGWESPPEFVGRAPGDTRPDRRIEEHRASVGDRAQGPDAASAAQAVEEFKRAMGMGGDA